LLISFDVEIDQVPNLLNQKDINWPVKQRRIVETDSSDTAADFHPTPRFGRQCLPNPYQY
jgi:hypothetical protein